MKVDLKKWWSLFGIAIFCLISLSFLHEIFLLAEVLVYFGGCGLAVLSVAKIVKALFEVYSETKMQKVIVKEKSQILSATEGEVKVNE